MKRAFVVALAAVMAFCLALPAFARTSIFGDVSVRNSLKLSGFSTMLDVTRRTPDGGITRFFFSYAFAEEGKDTLRWREIRPRDLTVELLWDVSKLISKPGKLILSSAAARDNTAKSPADCENADASGKITYVIYTISAIAPNPARIGRDRITFEEGRAFVEIGAGREWSRDGSLWHPADGNGPGGDRQVKWCSVPLSSARQTIFVRSGGDTTSSDNITMPSRRTVRVAVPAIPKAPRVNIYPDKGFISVRVGMEISNDGRTWARTTENTLPLSAVTALPASSGGGTTAVKNGIQVGVADAAQRSRVVDGQGFGHFYDHCGICVKPLTGAKPERTTYFIRTEPTSTTAASKPRRVRATSELRAPRVRVNEKKGVVRVRANTYVSINGTVRFHAAKTEIPAVGTIELWTGATARRAASAKHIMTR